MKNKSFNCKYRDHFLTDMTHSKRQVNKLKNTLTSEIVFQKKLRILSQKRSMTPLRQES